MISEGLREPDHGGPFLESEVEILCRVLSRGGMRSSMFSKICVENRLKGVKGLKQGH